MPPITTKMKVIQFKIFVSFKLLIIIFLNRPLLYYSILAES